MEDHELHGLIEQEDEFAHLAGTLATGLVSRRHRRLAYMTNQWPNRALVLLHSAEAAHRVAADLKLDSQLYEHMRKLEAPGKIVTSMLYRSVFRTTAVEQLVAGHTVAMWEPSADLRLLQQQRWQGVLSSVIIEELNGVMKNNGQARGSMKFRRPERSLAAALSSSVLTERNAYSGVRIDGLCPRQEPSMHSANAFGKKREDTWLDLQNISSTQQVAPYWSPSPENCGQPGADAQCWRDACAAGQEASLHHCALGAFSSYKHCIVFRRLPTETLPGIAWHFPLTHFQDSAVAAFPCEVSGVHGMRGKAFVAFPHQPRQPALFGIWDWAGITGMQCQWRSPAWQKAHLRHATWAPAVRLVPETEELPLAVLAAKAAFWSMEVREVRHVAQVLGCDVALQTSLHDVLMKVVAFVLPGSYTTTAAIVAQRLALERHALDESHEILMHSDEAAQCLDSKDERLLSKERDAARIREVAFCAFEADFRAAAQARRAALPKGLAKGKAKAKAKAAAKAVLGKVQLAMASQRDARLLLPPGAFVWKARRTSTWYTRLPPLGSHSRCVTKPHALHHVLCRIWEDWCLLHGETLASAPVTGYEANATDL